MPAVLSDFFLIHKAKIEQSNAKIELNHATTLK